MNIGPDHSIFMILLVCSHLECIFHYSLSGQRDRRLTAGGRGTPSEEISVGGLSELSCASFPGQTVFALCSDKMNSQKDTSLLEKSR